jgi:hypothetical protein
MQPPTMIAVHLEGEIGPPRPDRRVLPDVRASGLGPDFGLCFNR